MNTYISKYFNDIIKDLSNIFSEKESKDSKKPLKSFNTSKKDYLNISLALYLRTYEMSENTVSFSFNYIPRGVFTHIAQKRYRKIIDDLVENKIFVCNEHYLHSSNKSASFCKAYLMHYDMISAINKRRMKFEDEYVKVEVSDKIIEAFHWNSIDYSMNDKNNREKFIVGLPKNFKEPIEYFSKLTYDEEALSKFFGDDELKYDKMKRYLDKNLHLKPKYEKGRFYHAFHKLSENSSIRIGNKEKLHLRTSILRLDGEKIFEAFDIHGSSMHMMAKVLENKDIPNSELMKFQEDVKRDFRKDFGVTKNGKPTKFAKNAMNMYFNIQNENQYEYLRPTSAIGKIDRYFKNNFPTIREYLKSDKNTWLESFEEEFDTVSVRMIKRLSKMGIKAVSCHDAVYIKESDRDKADLNKLFYDCLFLAIDNQKNLYDL